MKTLKKTSYLIAFPDFHDRTFNFVAVPPVITTRVRSMDVVSVTVFIPPTSLVATGTM